jgi:hypothetical protein
LYFPSALYNPPRNFPQVKIQFQQRTCASDFS